MHAVEDQVEPPSDLLVRVPFEKRQHLELAAALMRPFQTRRKSVSSGNDPSRVDREDVQEFVLGGG